jgi:hypothetical protein
MARLGLDINLALQRLLAGNKERAAANRGALEDRKRTKENAAEKLQVAADTTRPGSPTQNEEPRGGTPDLYRPPEPAAQRRKKGFEVYGVELSSATPVLNSEVSFFEAFTWYILDFVVDNPPPYDNHTVVSSTTITNLNSNDYRKQDTYWKPEFALEKPRSRQFWLATPHQVKDHLLSFKWTFRQSSLNAGYNKVQEQRAVISDLALDLPSTTVVDETVYVKSDLSQGVKRTFTSCDGKYIYHSRLLRTIKPTSSIYDSPWTFNQSILDPDYYERFHLNIFRFSGSLRHRARHYEAQQWTQRLLPQKLSNRYQGGIINGPATSNLYRIHGLYWKFNARTKEPVSFESRLLASKPSGFFTTTEDHNAIDLFFGLMDPLTPVRRLYKETVGQSLANTLDEFFFDSAGFLLRWPPGLVYDEDRGWLTLVTTPYGLNIPRVFTLRVKNMPYSFSAIPVFYLPNKLEPLTKVEDYEAMGWKLEGPIPQNGLSYMDQYFALMQ